MKKIIIALILLNLFSCEEKKIEFVISEPSGNLILIKNSPEDNSLLKKRIKTFLIKNYSKYDKKITYYSFYKFTSDTKDFLKNREDYTGGFSDHNLDQYPQDELATFIISKCEKDSTKLVGELYYYGLKGAADGRKEIDTLIYYCK